MDVQHNTGARQRNHCWLGKAMGVTYSECVFVALVIQRIMHMSRIIWSYVACLTVPYFYILSHKWRDFRENCY